MSHKGPKSEDSGKEKPVSLSPLKLKEALTGLLAVKPPPESRSQKPEKKKDSKPKRES